MPRKDHSLSPKYERLNIVVLGKFNPAIFQPEWFCRHELLGEGDVEAASARPNIEAVLAGQNLPIRVDSDVSVFTADWITLQVDRRRFHAEVRGFNKVGPLRDFVLGTFGILEHCPLEAVGFNRTFHVEVGETRAELDALGHRLAPKGPWSALEKPGMLSLVMQGKRPQSPAQYARLKVQPSEKLQFGAFFDFNEHYPTPGGTADLRQFLEMHFEDALRYAVDTVARVVAPDSEERT